MQEKQLETIPALNLSWEQLKTILSQSPYPKGDPGCPPRRVLKVTLNVLLSWACIAEHCNFVFKRLCLSQLYTSNLRIQDCLIHMGIHSPSTGCLKVAPVECGVEIYEYLQHTARISWSGHRAGP